MLAPKRAALLYVRRAIQPLVEPLVVSWSFHPTPEFASSSRFVDLLQWTGTRDPAPYHTVPAAIQFMREQDCENVRLNCHRLLRQAIERICDLTDPPALYPLDTDFHSQMGIAPLPPCDPAALKSRLYDEYNIEVPVIQSQDRQFLRISIQGYNDQSDVDALLDALSRLLA
jgi:isopenicillin-N epimerase